MTSHLTLWGDRTGNCIRVAIALHEAGLPFEAKRVSLAAGENRLPDFIALNPLGKVPVLEEHTSCGQRVTAQSNAILLRIAAIAPGALIPTDVGAASLAMERFFLILTEVIAPAHAAFRLQREGEEDAARSLIAEAMRTAAHAERFVEQAPYIGGNAFTLADIAAFTILGSWDAFPWQRLPALSAWRERIASRPAVIAGSGVFSTEQHEPG